MEESPSTLDRLAALLVRWRRWLLALAALLAAACWIYDPQLTYDRRIESMFAADDPALLAYKKLQRTFGGNEVVVLVYRDPQAWEPGSGWRERLTEARRKAEQVTGVRSVLSVDRLLAAGPEDTAWVGSVRELFAGITHSADKPILALVCQLDPQTPDRQTSVSELYRLAEELPGGAVTGEPVMIVEGFRLVERDAWRLTIGSGLLLALAIWFCLRRLRWVVIPALIVQLSLMLTRSVLVLMRVELTIVSSMLTAVVLVVAVATLMHIAVRQQMFVADGMERTAALQRTLRELAMPVTFACLTDAAGFGALMTASLGPVHDFGLMLAVGSIAVLISTALLVPGLAGLPEPRRRPDRGRSEPPVLETGGWLGRWPAWLLRRRALVLAVSTAVSLVFGLGCWHLQIESDFTRNFRSTSTLVESYRVVESDMGGAGVCDVILPAPARLDWNYLSRVLALEESLRAELGATGGARGARTGLTKVISLADAVAQLSPLDLEKTPRLLRGAAVRTGLSMMRRELPDFYQALYGRDPDNGQFYFRIMLRTYERQPAEAKTELIAAIQRIVREQAPEAEVTGYFVLLTELIRSLLADQWLTFGVAMGCILLMMMVAFRRPFWAAAALIPNVVPIVLVLGTLGWLGVWDEQLFRVNMGVAMIAAVSSGLSVDASVHYLMDYRRQRADHTGPLEALAATHSRVGRSLGLATLALVIGFVVLCTSEFMPTVYFGALASLTMIGGALGNLILLPVLVAPWRREAD